MTKERFAELVKRLEATARSNPRAYGMKVWLLAILGNAYLAIVILLVAALLSLVVAAFLLGEVKLVLIQALLGLGFFLGMILKAVWIRVEPPHGIEIGPDDSPELFAMVEDLRRTLDSPRFHTILVTDEFNAAVAQVPRLGLFGWPRNYLILGLPLMKALTVEQFKAVLAHEFGHLARGHGRIGNWIYRQRMRWARLVEALDATESRGQFLFKPFLNRYAPYFNAYSFPLARANEYEADATSVRLTSPRAAAEALTNINVVAQFLDEKYWPAIYKQANDRPRPDHTPYGSLGEQLGADMDETSVRRWLRFALTQDAGLSDTHPPLSERLAAIGHAPRLAPPEPGETADLLLGDALARTTEELDRVWREMVEPAWQEHHQATQTGRKRLAELERKVLARGELPINEAFERALLTADVADQPEQALDQLRDLQARDPGHPGVNFELGLRLLQRDDDTGISFLETAMEREDRLRLDVLQALRTFHWRQGHDAEAKAFERRIDERMEEEYEGSLERERVHLKDRFEPHGLEDDALQSLRVQLHEMGDIREAYLVRRQVKHLTHLPFLIFGFSVTGFFRIARQKRLREYVDRISETVEFPCETMILCIDGNNRAFRKKLKKVKGSRVI
jgi:Zn-dependent protease with chaperone function